MNFRGIHRKRQGLTLIEIIIVVAIIAVLLIIAFVVLNPQEQLYVTREAVADQQGKELERAVHYFMQDYVMEPGSGEIPQGFRYRKNICIENLPGAQVNNIQCVVLDEVVDAGEIPTLPQHYRWKEVDPQGRVLGYTIYKEGVNVIIGPPIIPHALLFNDGMAPIIPVNQDGYDVPNDGAFSIVAWTKGASGDGGFVYRKREAGVYGKYEMESKPSSSDSHFAMRINDGVTDDSYGLALLSPSNAYSMHTMTYQYSEEGGVPHSKMIFYHDTSPTTYSPVLIDITNDAPFTIGDINMPAGVLLDDLKFYNRALTPEEVATLHNNEPVPDGLLHHWDFDEGDNETIYDNACPGCTEEEKLTVAPGVQWSRDTAFGLPLP